jgi:hypothetical protein
MKFKLPAQHLQEALLGYVGGAVAKGLEGHSKKHEKKEEKSKVQEALDNERERHAEGHKQRVMHKGY